MKPVIQDLPEVSAATLRALGVIGPETKATTIAFGDIEFVVEVALHSFPQGGSWSKFRCPRCARRCRKLRLFEGAPMCGRCIHAAGMLHRAEMCSHFAKRAALLAPERIERLAHVGRTGIKRRLVLPRRANLELKLKRSLIVARQYAIDEHDKMLKGK
jgi:hypothetical protein